ncbi:hypothetical protein PHSY_005600 [Pseudozyma hubeiensis SY62]|uniref:DNA replication regulator Sld3 C-terminal domain-containing protein n=1 Tax=Pseudozyma hubeiensis (strain SY62) TaxID=1305764 RepID=R9P9T5_PSEHS|nr:hypothetical protein PHSY_005600 [Pseudozyma hubeiensis SY62]GAC98012.1 hypothetical protein PHSY_005600 [Pseudozyma hubeiensis SY62]
MALLVETHGHSLDCQAGPSRPATTATSTLYIDHACYLEQPEATSWFSNHDKTIPDDQSHQHESNSQQTLESCYVETLWLGEHHTGLAHFLNCIDRLRSSHDLEDVLLGLCQLTRSNSAISRRHKVIASKLFPGLNQSSATFGEHTPTEYELMLAQRTTKAVASAATSGETDLLRDRLVSSMESRETQLQILITMCLLHIASQDPRALEAARARMTVVSSSHIVEDTATSVNMAPEPEADSEQPRKRSRKLEKAKRWRGTRPSSESSDAFAWNQQVRRRLATDSSHDDAEGGEGELLEIKGGEVLAVDHLSKRLEALVDILCLRQVASGIGSEIGDLLSDMGAETMSDGKDVPSKAKPKAMLFGSALRKLIEDDDMDDAQWLCSCVVEPHFEASLPRQCSLFRSKCFVSLQSRTPARPSKSARPASSGSPPMRAPKRNTSLAAVGASTMSLSGSGLSDVLEKEQVGRRVKRNVLAERSSMLGRGREVDMGRRLSRSVSANLGPGHQIRASTGVFSRSSTNASFTQSVSTLAPRAVKAEAASQRIDIAGRTSNARPAALVHKPSLAAAATHDGGSSGSGSRPFLVMSTPQKDSGSKTMNVSLNHLSHIDTPKLVFPSNSLVMESPTQDNSHMFTQRTRVAERCASFAGRTSFALNRSPSPVSIAFDSDVDD